MSQTQQNPTQQPPTASSGVAPAASGPPAQPAAAEPAAAEPASFEPVSRVPVSVEFASAEHVSRGDRVAAAVRGWQRHLGDLGGPNTLLWYRDLASGTLDLTTAHPGGMAMLLAGRPTRLSDLVREPTALAEARRRARTVRAKTVELYEERGLATGYLAVGMATWQAPGRSRSPCAPVLLRPCVLRPTGADQQDFDIDLGDEVELNPVLGQYLRSEQGIEIDSEALEELATFTSGFDPHPVFAALGRMCQRLPAFQIAPRLVLGTFSCSKLPMVADLAAQLDTLSGHDIVAALAGDPEARQVVRTSIPDPAADADPAEEHLVLDADSHQQAVIDAVRSGTNLVVTGPPGTGKSQTIANLVASLASEGKRTLFVSEKRAAIDTVIGRLERLGLGDLVLDARDGRSNSRRLARELGAVLSRAGDAQYPDMASIHNTVAARRAELVEHCSALHEIRQPWGVSVFDAQVALARLSARRVSPTSRVRIQGQALKDISRTRLDELGRSLAQAATLGAWLPGEAEEDPWYGANVTSPDEVAEAVGIAGRLGGAGMHEAQERLAATMREMGLPDAQTPAAWGRALGLIEQVRQTLDIFRVEVFDVPLTDLVGATAGDDYRQAQGLRLGAWSRMRLRRQARDLLRPGAPPDDLHAALKVAQEQRVAWAELAGPGGRPDVPDGIDDIEDTYETLARDLGWLGARLATTEAGGDLMGTPLVDLRARLAALSRRPDRCAVLPNVVSVIDDLRRSGMGALVDDLAARGVDALDVRSETEFVWWTSLIDEVSADDPAYGAHDGDRLRRVAADYVEADHAHLAGTVDRVRAAVGRRLKEVIADHPERAALVRAEASRSRRHHCLRELLPAAGETLTAIKPCWAMSPLVVASVVPPGRWFDVVIFDEASQITTAEAVSAISRAAQVVVFGDDRQLFPMGFTVAALDGAEGAEGADVAKGGDRTDGADGSDDAGGADDFSTRAFESILDGLSTVVPIRRLTWHYRSQDERLVSFANARVYDGRLVTFPGAGDEAVLSLEVVDGSAAVQPGMEAIESTQAEVDRVVRLVLSHARTRPAESLGVIALGPTHAARIDDALRAALSDTDGVGGFFDDTGAERFFVKSLERVQGDERDAIILTVGYGKTPHGRVLHRFGSLNLEGGDRRLNVAITRARRRITVVSSFTAADLDSSRLKAPGPLMLRDYLSYAAQGGSYPAQVGITQSARVRTGPVRREVAKPDPHGDAGSDRGGDHDGADNVGADHVVAPVTQRDPLVADLASRLRSAGLVVHADFGMSAQRLELAVEDPRRPGRVLVAVETDGPDYAAMASTRDRDRLRVEHLRSLGWEHVRVWSTDLFRDPARDVARVIAAVQAASAARFAGTGPADTGPVETGPVETGPVEARPAETGNAESASAEAGPAETGNAESASAGSRPQFASSRSKPEQSRDDTDAGWGERPDQEAQDEWLREQRPPHWG